MSYLINRFDGSELVVLQDNTVDTTTSLSLVGRNTVGYGELQNENFVFLLENFSNDAPPSKPLTGQLWYDNENKALKYYDEQENWKPVGGATVSSEAPANPGVGSLWLKSDTSELQIWTGSEWKFIGPENSIGFDLTRNVSASLIGEDGIEYPVILVTVNGTVIGIYSKTSFIIELNSRPEGFFSLEKGLNLSETSALTGRLNGIALQAEKLSTLRTINGVIFDGSKNIDITANTRNPLISGDYIVGDNFNGVSSATWSVDATPENKIGKVVARDVSGDFSAGTITADLVGDVKGNVTAESGTSRFNVIEANTIISLRDEIGTALNAIKLANPRTINGATFDGTEDIIVSAAANTLTDNQLAPNVVFSSLQRVGKLDNLNVNDAVSIGPSVASDEIIIRPTTGNDYTGEIKARDNLKITAGNDSLGFVSGENARSASIGGNAVLLPINNTVDIGQTGRSFNEVHANQFIGDLTGNASSATTATSTANVSGGTAGSILYQSAPNETVSLPLGTAGQILKSTGAGDIFWDDQTLGTLEAGSFLIGLDYNGGADRTWHVNASFQNLADTVVSRDSNGNFLAGTVTADFEGTLTGNVIGNVTGNLTGNVIGNADTATALASTVQINGVDFDGTGNIVLEANDPNKLALAGGTLTGPLTLAADPSNNLQAATKQYVDSSINQYGLIKAFVRFKGDDTSNIKVSRNVDSVQLIAGGTYRINLSSGTFDNENYLVQGIATDVDHFVSLKESTATYTDIYTNDNSGANDSPSNTTGDVMVSFIV